MATSDAPVEIGNVALVVRDLDKVANFYRDVIGLHPLSRDGEVATLGIGSKVLLELRGDKAAALRNPRGAGLFHTAFLLPSHTELGNWLRHMAIGQHRIQGASDHLVSEAIYLADPEGNGIEVYADRPRDSWRWTGGEIAMSTEALDLNALLADANAEWKGVPEGSVIGHVHLQTGAVPEAEAFYSGTLGMAITTHYPGAAFYSSGGYHHHFATNIWNSRGAGPKPEGAAGLAEVVLSADTPEIAAVAERAGKAVGANSRSLSLVDPWNLTVTLSPKETQHAG
jgi:catechol 2,3-dioxygenase